MEKREHRNFQFLIELYEIKKPTLRKNYCLEKLNKHKINISSSVKITKDKYNIEYMQTN